jgi:hypothetical protein
VREQVGRYLGYSGRGANAFGKEARYLKPGLMNRKFRETCEVVTRREVLVLRAGNLLRVNCRSKTSVFPYFDRP